MDVTFVVEFLSPSEWVVVCDPYGIPVKTFRFYDDAESYASMMRSESLSFVPFFSDLHF